MRIRPFLLAPLLALALSGCAHSAGHPAPTATAPTLTGDPAHPGTTQGWVDTRLYFGLGTIDHPEQSISESQWRAFLDRDVYGQWQGKDQAAPERLRSKMLIIDYADTAENREKIEAIRTAWKQKTGDQSVMRVTQPADVSF